jgi:HJR/Mrr/RecB family endonuclease
MTPPTPTQDSIIRYQEGSVVRTLTDGTGISQFTLTKFVKDFVADVLLSGAAALVAVQVVDVSSAVAQPQIVTFALLGAVVRAGYRAALRWATT